MSPIRETNDEKKKSKVFVNGKFYDHDFSNKDLTHADFRGCVLVNCNFDSCDLSYATFEGANCYRSTFRQARLYHVNFKDAVLAETFIDPRDMFAASVTLSCDTFDRTKMGPVWIAAWLYLITLAEIPDKTKEKIDEALLELIGEERLKGLKRHFAERTL